MLHTNQGVWRTHGCGRCVIDNGSWVPSWARHMSKRPEGWCVCSRSSVFVPATEGAGAGRV